MKRTHLLLGHSDIEGQEVSTRKQVSGGTRVTTDLVGVLPVLPWIQGDKVLSRYCSPILVTANTRLPEPDPRLNLFNLVGDPDSSYNSLLRIQKYINAVRPGRCFNSPARVIRTSRASLPGTLAKIPGCIMPRALSTDSRNVDELRSACLDFDCWPLILRARGYHGGEYMVMLKDVSELESVSHQEWLYQGIFLIEYVDYRGDDGLYQKTRAVMIDGSPFLRHSIYTDSWAIHSGSRAALMDGDMGLCDRERRFLGEFRHAGFQKYAGVFQQIYERVRLDVFGIDFSIVDGKILIFEANACMSFVGKRHGSDEQYGYLDPYLTAIRRALRTMLVKGTGKSI